MNLDDVRQIREACLTHAEELISAARRLQGDFPHLAYHLTALALEEIGKSASLVLEVHPGRPEDTEGFLAKIREDHVKKLFWSLWGATFTSERITSQQIESHRGLAHQIHEARLAGIYVDWRDGQLSIPRDIITEERARLLVELAEARLGLERAFDLRDLDESDRELAAWFASAARDEEKADMVFHRASLDKLHEVRDVPAWVRWLKEQFDESERKARESLAKELARSEPSHAERAEEKWKVRIRLLTPSHSVRQAPLARWNKITKYIQLHRGSGHQELLIDFLLPKGISIHALWDAALEYAQRWIMALNIGSAGFFWWHIPKDVSRFYERIEDLEARREVRVERVPKLRLNWGHNVLDEAVLSRTVLAFRFVPTLWEQQTGLEPFEHYVTGLAFLGKSDIHLRLEANAFFAFFRAFKTATRVYNDWDGQSPFTEAASGILGNVAPRAEPWKELEAGEMMDKEQEPPGEITLAEVGRMKLYCDGYLLWVFSKLAQ